MKYIQKQDEPKELLDWKKRTKASDKNYKYLSEKGSKSERQKLADRDVKDALRISLLQEQGYICCYCEQELRTDSDQIHIEHFRPRSKFPNQSLDYHNLFFCCGSVRRGKKQVRKHCGCKKGSWFDEALLISPLDKNCEKQFLYTLDGEAEPALTSENASKETITRLGLNDPKLIALRKQVVDICLYLDDEDLKIWVKDYLEKKDGKFKPFWTTIDQLAKTLISN